MFPFASPLRKSPELRRIFALVLASAEDQIVQANVDEATTFLKATEAHLTFENALSIFFRLVGLPRRMEDAVTIQSLSRIGESEDIEELVDDVPPADPGAVRALARRLLGRRSEELRQEIETMAKQARARLKGVYIEGAHRAAEALRDVVSPKEAVQYYVTALEIGPEWTELIMHEVVGAEWAELPDETVADAATGPIERGGDVPDVTPLPEPVRMPLPPESPPNQPPTAEG